MVRIRRIDASNCNEDLIVYVPRNRTVAQLREHIKSERNIPVEDQKLYFHGKELVDDHQIFDYGIKQHHIINLIVKSKDSNNIVEHEPEEDLKTSSNVEENNEEKDEEGNLVASHSKYYSLGDLVDARLEAWDNAWFEGEIEQIFHNTNIPESDDEKHLVFSCKIFKYSHMDSFRVCFKDLRPVSFHKFNVKDVKSGMRILANVNIDEPKKRGSWYEFDVKEVSSKEIQGVALTRVPVECKVYILNELFRLEEAVLSSEKTDVGKPTAHRNYAEDCTACHDNMRRNCKKCGCHACGKKDYLDSILLCDECDFGFHLECLNPPLSEVPEGDWFCPGCKNDDSEIVKAGERLTHNSKKITKTRIKKDWDNGMACAGRSKECTIVPKNHFGPVPGVDVGMLWKFRTQVSEAGIHRPIVAGIHGRSDEGAYSIVLSGGYEDDIDEGDEFEYTGAGGRDLSGNKRVSEQTCDQLLTQTNKALALCCNAKFNDANGAEATDWREGKPVRVVRKHGKCKFTPQDGYRYDGIYKVVKYYPQKGRSGFKVWKYVLRRDDPSPAPWSKEAPTFEMIVIYLDTHVDYFRFRLFQYPPDYFELEAAKKKKSSEKSQNKNKIEKRKKENSVGEDQANCKKVKSDNNEYSLAHDLDDKINSDVLNAKYWKECRKALIEGGKKEFFDKITESFMCICCLELVNKPVTLTCGHNVCKSCLQRSFKADITACPNCRHDLGKQYKIDVNVTLYEILKELFKGYERGR